MITKILGILFLLAPFVGVVCYGIWIQGIRSWEILMAFVGALAIIGSVVLGTYLITK